MRNAVNQRFISVFCLSGCHWTWNSPNMSHQVSPLLLLSATFFQTMCAETHCSWNKLCVVSPRFAATSPRLELQRCLDISVWLWLTQRTFPCTVCIQLVLFLLYIRELKLRRLSFKLNTLRSSPANVTVDTSCLPQLLSCGVQVSSRKISKSFFFFIFSPQAGQIQSSSNTIPTSKAEWVTVQMDTVLFSWAHWQDPQPCIHSRHWVPFVTSLV